MCDERPKLTVGILIQSVYIDPMSVEGTFDRYNVVRTHRSNHLPIQCSIDPIIHQANAISDQEFYIQSHGLNVA